MALLRATPEDFAVEELPLYPPSGEGGHTFVLVEKRLQDTDALARELARAAGVAPRDVGYAGRKDRVAVTRQWFSVPGVDPEAALALELPGARVLAAQRHPHKLRTGQLAGNRFRIVLREAGPALREGAATALSELVRHGLSNRFGPQRYGRDGRNPERGLALLRGGRGPRDRRRARFLVSALQAAVFDEALRTRALPLDALEAGDVAVVHASGGLFRVESLEREAPRAAAFEISATGPIFGSRMVEPAGAPAERERRALERLGLDPDAPLRSPRGIRLRGARRPLRVQPGEAQAEPDGDALQLAFTLPAGSYASVLVEELAARCGGETLREGPASVIPFPAGGSPP